MPTLNEALELISASALFEKDRVFYNIELKGVGTAELVSVEIESLSLRQFWFNDEFFQFSSLHSIHAELSAFKNIRSQIPFIR